MKKTKRLLCFALAGCVSVLAASCGGEQVKESGSESGKTENEYTEILADGNFDLGFNLYGPDSRYHALFPWAQLTFDSAEDPLWKLDTWGCFVNYWSDTERTFVEDGKTYTYPARPLAAKKNGNYTEIANGTTTVSVDPDRGTIVMKQDASEEYGVTPAYGDSPRISSPRKNGEAWPHLLIEQYLVSNKAAGDFDEIVYSLEFSVDECENLTGEGYDSSLHAAQLQWYTTFKCAKQDSKFFNRYIWFGIPLFDSRTDRVTQSAFLDGGKEDSTGMLIYVTDAFDFVPEKIETGKRYRASVNMKPQIEQAFSAAQKKGLFTDCTLEDMKFDTMNIGWELPGTFRVASTISGLSIGCK